MCGCLAHGRIADLLDVLALELADELGEAVLLGVNTDGGQDGLDVLGLRGVLAAELEEEVCCEVLHLEGADQLVAR